MEQNEDEFWTSKFKGKKKKSYLVSLHVFPEEWAEFSLFAL